jgi:hypothetical protein
VIGYLRQARGQREEGQPEQDALPAGALHRAGPYRVARFGLTENPYQRPAFGPVRGRPCAVRAPQRENILAFIGAARGPRTRPLRGLGHPAALSLAGYRGSRNMITNGNGNRNRNRIRSRISWQQHAHTVGATPQARALGVPDRDNFDTGDLFDGSNMRQVRPPALIVRLATAAVSRWARSHSPYSCRQRGRTRGAVSAVADIRGTRSRSARSCHWRLTRHSAATRRSHGAEIHETLASNLLLPGSGAESVHPGAGAGYNLPDGARPRGARRGGIRRALPRHARLVTRHSSLMTRPPERTTRLAYFSTYQQPCPLVTDSGWPASAGPAMPQR